VREVVSHAYPPTQSEDVLQTTEQVLELPRQKYGAHACTLPSLFCCEVLSGLQVDVGVLQTFAEHVKPVEQSAFVLHEELQLVAAHT
jgi:hypothetical protein